MPLLPRQISLAVFRVHIENGLAVAFGVGLTGLAAGGALGLDAAQIALETRIITVADIFDAISAERPYHPPTPVDETLAIMRKAVGTAIDADCFAALERVIASTDDGSRASLSFSNHGIPA